MHTIKVGNRIINVDAISHINLDALNLNFSSDVPGKRGVSITMLSLTADMSESTISETFFFEGEEAIAIAQHFEKIAHDVVGFYQKFSKVTPKTSTDAQ